MSCSSNSISNLGDALGRTLDRCLQIGLLMPLSTQIAGHGSEADGHRTFLKRKDGRLLKPLQAPPKGERERAFYERLNSDDADDTDRRLLKHVPGYFGVERLGGGGDDPKDAYLVLEDLSEHYALPNIMDIKLGSQTYDPDASEKKRQAEDGKYVGTKLPLGFSVLGIIVHPLKRGGGDDAMTRYDKSYGKKLKTEDVADVPRIFFDVERSGLVRPLVEVVVRRMRDILEMYERQRKYRLYASSLLFGYDVQKVRNFLQEGNAADAAALEEAVSIKIIDFAHVFPAPDDRPDENFLKGLRNLIDIFEQLLA